MGGVLPEAKLYIIKKKNVHMLSTKSEPVFFFFFEKHIFRLDIENPRCYTANPLIEKN